MRNEESNLLRLTCAKVDLPSQRLLRIFTLLDDGHVLHNDFLRGHEQGVDHVVADDANAG